MSIRISYVQIFNTNSQQSFEDCEKRCKTLTRPFYLTGKAKIKLINCWTLLTGTIPDLEDFEGDILLTKVQKAMTLPFSQDVAAAGVWSKVDFLWPERTVPYYIPPDLGKNTILCLPMRRKVL